MHVKLFLRKCYKGFTFIELMVSMSLFVSVITIAIGTLYSAQNLNVRLQASHVIIDSMGAAFETMVRDIRYGTVFNCGNDSLDTSLLLRRKNCPYDPTNVNTGGTVLVFKPGEDIGSSGSTRHIYKLVNNNIIYSVYNSVNHSVNYGIDQTGVNSLQYFDSPSLEFSSAALNPSEVAIESLRFFVSGANTSQQAVDSGNGENEDASTDVLQPLITVVVNGSIKPQTNNLIKQAVTFQLQTTITPRSLDF